jgi:hypothetical protein
MSEHVRRGVRRQGWKRCLAGYGDPGPGDTPVLVIDNTPEAREILANAAYAVYLLNGNIRETLKIVLGPPQEPS